ncbi:MAG: DNA methyltransferase [Candidatus Bathyarchaeia archaeon]
MARLFFLISGENPTLPYSEVKAILESEGYSYSVLGELTQLLRVEADARCAETVRFRSALAKACCLEIFWCRADVDEILSAVKCVDFTQFMSEGETFIVRVLRVRGDSPEISCLALEKEIGEIIFEESRGRGIRVDLKRPSKTFLGILTDGMFFFGLRLAEIKHRDLLERGPRRRLFFHPAAMTAKMARCMVNLARAKAGNLVLDPFCGTGSLLIEAGLIGCRIIGLDVKRRMIEGSRMNLRSFGIEPEGLVVADARFPPITSMKVDHIVTDPPYGSAASTLGLSTKNILEYFFLKAADVLRNGGFICVAAPKTIGIQEIGKRHGFKHLESHFIYVHRRLTREIAVFRRSGDD